MGGVRTGERFNVLFYNKKAGVGGRIAQGTSGEVETYLMFMKDLSYIKMTEYNELESHPLFFTKGKTV